MNPIEPNTEGVAMPADAAVPEPLPDEPGTIDVLQQVADATGISREELTADPAPMPGGEAAEVTAIVDMGDGASTEVAGEPVQVEAIAAGLSALAQQASAGDDALRAEDGIFGPTGDANQAMKAITELNHEVVGARREWEGLKEDAAAAKKTYDRLAERLSNLIEEYAARHRASTHRPGDAPVQPYLAPVVDAPKAEAPADGLCAFERETGLPCAVCRGTAVSPITDIPTEALVASDPQHQVVAERYSLERLLGLLEQRGLLEVRVDDLRAIERADLQALAEWAGRTDLAPGAFPPPFVVKHSHVADQPADGQQRCGCCGAVLRLEALHLPAADGPDGPPETAWYPAGTWVGLDCAGPVGDAPAAAPGPEPARILPMRGGKNRRKKADPEGERAEQVEAAAAVQENDTPAP